LDTTVTPPWLVDIVGISDVISEGGRGQLKHRRRRATESVSCHITARHMTSTWRSRRSPSRSSTLFISEHILRKLNGSRPVDEIDGDVVQTSISVTGWWQWRRHRRVDGRGTVYNVRSAANRRQPGNGATYADVNKQTVLRWWQHRRHADSPRVEFTQPMLYALRRCGCQ